VTPFRAVLFDFDGTLGDSYAAITASINFVRARHGLPALTVAEVRPHVGRGPDNLMRQTVPGFDPVADDAAYSAHHPTVMRQMTRLMPGAPELLDALAAAGRRLAVCSNKRIAYTRDLLASLGVAGRFGAVLGPEEVGGRSKPAPDMLLAALRRLGVAAGEALYVGDMTIDVQTGRAAGVAVWTVATGSDERPTLEAAGPDRVFSCLAEVRTALAI
jgi:phosphoglycolate phosphatase